MSDSEPDDGYEAIFRWLSQCQTGTFLSWGSDDLTSDSPFAIKWADIRIPEMDSEVGVNWSFTVEALDGPRIQRTSIFPPYDIDVHQIWDQGGDHFIGELVIPHGTHPAPEDMVRLATLLNGGTERTYTVDPGWSAVRISEALRFWVRHEVRRNDIFFTWDTTMAESVMLQTAIDQEERIRLGLVQTYDLGDGVLITSDAMDEFLAMDPDEAAKLTQAMKTIADHEIKARGQDR